MKHVGQALENRLLIDSLFDGNEQALNAVCGEFDAVSDEVPMGDSGRGRRDEQSAPDWSVMTPCEETVSDPCKAGSADARGVYTEVHEQAEGLRTPLAGFFNALLGLVKTSIPRLELDHESLCTGPEHIFDKLSKVLWFKPKLTR